MGLKLRKVYEEKIKASVGEAILIGRGRRGNKRWGDCSVRKVGGNIVLTAKGGLYGARCIFESAPVAVNSGWSIKNLEVTGTANTASSCYLAESPFTGTPKNIYESKGGIKVGIKRMRYVFACEFGTDNKTSRRTVTIAKLNVLGAPGKGGQASNSIYSGKL